MIGFLRALLRILNAFSAFSRGPRGIARRQGNKLIARGVRKVWLRR